MRIRNKVGSLSFQAIAGSYVVLLGMDVDPQAVPGLLGFAIERTDPTENEKYWLRGMRTFEETDPGLPKGSLVSLLEHPAQSFFWGDYTAKPGRPYTYRVVAMYGSPKNLEQRDSVPVQVTTEDEEHGIHSVWFNRGVAGSQAYVRKFGEKKPADVPDRKAYMWLSRGLEEALLGFIGQAKDSTFALRAAMYEFGYGPVLDAFQAARQGGADVRIVMDAKENSEEKPRQPNLEAIEKAGIDDLVKRRESNSSYIAHNKFIVLLRNGAPQEVWTGSTNVTQGGIFGHSNVGHVVRDPQIAARYLAYWTELDGDPEAKQLRPWNEEQSPVPAGDPPKNSVVTIFSPRGSLEALEWYAKEMDGAQSSVFLTAAFGVNDKLAQVLGQDKSYLRYVLLDKEGSNMEVLKRDPDTRIAVGSLIESGGPTQWLGESLTGFNVHVQYIHTKYMLIDALSDDPIVISGSANFSDASTIRNDENMLVIRGDKRVTDIYLGEFMRLFNHFLFRDMVEKQTGQPEAKKKAGGHLSPDDSWAQPFYKKDSVKEKERLLFR